MKMEGMEILKQTEVITKEFPIWATILTIIVIAVGIIAGIVKACYEGEFGYFSYNRSRCCNMFVAGICSRYLFSERGTHR